MAGNITESSIGNAGVPLESCQKALDKYRSKYEQPGETLVIVTPPRYQEVRDMIKNYFLPHEPLSIAFSANYDDVIETAIDEALESNLSICTISNETGKITAVGLCKIIRKTDPPLDFAALGQSPFADLFRFLSHRDDEVDLFERYGVDEAFYLFAGCIHPKYRHMGFGKRLLGPLIDMSRELGFEVFKIECTSSYSQSIVERWGFKTLARLSYDTYKTPDGYLIAERTGCHTSTNIYGYRL